MKIIDAAKRAMGMIVVDAEKRDGVFVSRKLDPRNAKKWSDWATKYGVPNVVPVEEMHVTILHSTIDVKVPLVETGVNIETSSRSFGVGAFAMFGPEEAALVFAFSSWELHDRHWCFLEAGAVCTWPNYRPHLTISADAAGFELPDEALTDVPSFIVLGPETAEPLKSQGDVEKSDSRLEVSDELKQAAAALVKADGDKMSIIDRYDLADISKGRLSKETAERLGAEDWAPAELKASLVPKVSETRKRVERELTISISQLPEELAKRFAASAVAKNNEAEQIVMGIASVSTMGGELVTDSHGDQITTQALVEFNRSLISGSRAGKFEHEGEAVTEVVAGLVLTADWQKSLGIELGYEPYLVEIHVPDPGDWAEVQKGEWMLSVAGTMWHWATEGEDA